MTTKRNNTTHNEVVVERVLTSDAFLTREIKKAPMKTTGDSLIADLTHLPNDLKITIQGAREHNLKNVDLEFPRNRMVVFTGLSGSGKSSLAFDTLFAEGQRRYVESLSAYARQFLGQMDKPDVDFIEGLSPAVSIDQKTTNRNPRSTVGTITEIYDYLRLLFARTGIPHCPECGALVSAQTPQQMVDTLLKYPERTRFQILAPVVRGRKGEFEDLLELLRGDGYARALIDGEMRQLSDDIKLAKQKKHTIEVVVDRLVVKDGIRQRLESRVNRGKLSAEQAQALLARITPATELNQLADAQLVIEAASERLEIKQALFSQLAEICSPSTLLTSNTSSISITAIAAGIKHPERVAGLHFFNPAPVMKLVEVVSGLATSAEVVEQLCACVSRWGKQAVRCRSTPGFIVNRVARPYYAEAWRALEEQVASAEVIDAALRDGGGFPMGPLALTDLIGQDVNFAVTCSVFNAFWQDRRFLPSLVQQELALAGRLGKKSGQGVYRWPIESASVPALAAVAETRGAKTVCTTGDSVTGRVAIALDDVRLLETEGETAQALSVRYGCPVVVYDYCAGDTVVLATAATNPASATDKAVRYFQQQGKKVLLIADYPGLLVWRTLAMLINEALDAVQKGVASPEDIDTAMRLGVNYPHGPLAWGERLGWRRVLQLLENLQHHYGEERYRPSSLLRQKALMEKHHEQ